MFFKFPKDDKDFTWTRHIKDKMLFYHISEQKIKSILKAPDRREEGIALNTNAAMKVSKKGKAAPFSRGEPRPFRKNGREEIWVMYQPVKRAKSKSQILNSKAIMISTWRYPGKSKPGKEIPIPEDILTELGLS